MPRKMKPNQALSAVTEDMRWKILGLLKEPLTPKELAKKLHTRPAVVLYHLKILLKAGGIVAKRQPGYRRRYTFQRVMLQASVRVDSESNTVTFESIVD